MTDLLFTIDLSPGIRDSSAADFFAGASSSVPERDIIVRQGHHAALSVRIGATGAASSSVAGNYHPDISLRDDQWTLIDGRVVNLSDTISRFGPGSDYCGAKAVSRLWRSNGTGFFSGLKGGFCLLVAEPAKSRVILYRSRLGQKPLYYHADQVRCVIATEEQFVAAHPVVGTEIDETVLAARFAIQSAHHVGHTVFQNIRELLPGEWLVWDKGKTTRQQVPLEFGQSLLRYRSDGEYAEHYRELLDQMVARCLPGNGLVGVMLSSGLDSAPSATIAASQLRGQGRMLKAYSWCLPGFETADESAQIRQVADYINIPLELISGSDRWPLFDHDDIFVTANSPLANAFQGVKDLVFEAAGADGCKVLLNGWFGDSLFMFSQRALVTDAVRLGQGYLALCELGYWLRRKGWQGIARKAGSLFSPVAPDRSLAQPWLTDFSRGRLSAPDWPPESAEHRNAEHFRAMTAPGNFQNGGNTKALSRLHGVEQVDLYRDEDLVDFILSIPLTQLMRLGQTKYIARNAAKGLLPENIRLQRRVGLMNEFFNYGVWHKERAWLQERLFDSSCSWDKYVDRTWLRKQFDQAAPTDKAGLVAWQCLTYELWLEKVRQLKTATH